MEEAPSFQDTQIHPGHSYPSWKAQEKARLLGAGLVQLSLWPRGAVAVAAHWVIVCANQPLTRAIVCANQTLTRAITSPCWLGVPRQHRGYCCHVLVCCSSGQTAQQRQREWKRHCLPVSFGFEETNIQGKSAFAVGGCSRSSCRQPPT